MSSRSPLLLLLPLLAGTLTTPLAAQEPDDGDPGRLYGRVTTSDGAVHTGFIRWGANEAGWFDILHGDKRIPERNLRQAEELGWEPREEENRIEIFGIGITLPSEGNDLPTSAQSGIRFGHISSLEPTGDDRARLVLKSGDELELRSNGDLGESLGEIRVEDPRGGIVELEWREVRAIDFIGGPPVPSRMGTRLHGTLVTRTGDRFIGYIAWDMDEVFTEDVLDGEEEGREREIPFGRIRGIASRGSSGSLVLLEDGTEVLLRGSNDVNDENRDIMVADPTLGEVRVEWDAFDRIEFSPPPVRPEFGAFDGGRRLRGTVVERGGRERTGFIRWDNDEEYTWEILDGELRDGVVFDIEFGRIGSIERVGFETSRVTLKDGRSFLLGESNDVDEDNKGVYVVSADGSVVLVPWDRFERVEFQG